MESNLAQKRWHSGSQSAYRHRCCCLCTVNVACISLIRPYRTILEPQLGCLCGGNLFTHSKSQHTITHTHTHTLAFLSFFPQKLFSTKNTPFFAPRFLKKKQKKGSKSTLQLQLWDRHLNFLKLAHDSLQHLGTVHLVEPAVQVRILGAQDLVKHAHAKEHLAHDKDVCNREAVAHQVLAGREVVVEALAAGVEAAEAVLGVFAHGLVAADEGEDDAADWTHACVSSAGTHVFFLGKRQTRTVGKKIRVGHGHPLQNLVILALGRPEQRGRVTLGQDYWIALAAPHRQVSQPAPGAAAFQASQKGERNRETTYGIT